MFGASNTSVADFESSERRCVGNPFIGPMYGSPSRLISVDRGERVSPVSNVHHGGREANP